MTLYTLRGHLDQELSWEQIGLPCEDLSACRSHAERYTEYYGVVEVINATTGAGCVQG